MYVYVTMYIHICINAHACICKYILQVNVVHMKSGAFIHGCISVKLLQNSDQALGCIVVFLINTNS